MTGYLVTGDGGQAWLCADRDKAEARALTLDHAVIREAHANEWMPLFPPQKEIEQ